MCSKTADKLRWHDEERSKDGKLRHPADGQAWKDFDSLHPDFAKDSRNVRLGLASDGFNPFRTMSISHSTWPVVLMVYNFPPWMSMKQEYCMLSLLISGPRSPGNDIDIYLQPLIEELKVLWELGVDTYDASRNQTFQMRASLMWTINDFPAYAMLSGWSTKGKLACPCCNYGTNSCYLKHSRKMCYMDHRVFLPMDHPWRSNKRSYNGKTEFRPPPQLLKGTDVFNMLQNVENVFGKKQKKSNHNSLRHNLDVMHIEKNIFDNIIGTLLDISGKTKDHENARYDLKEMGIRKNLQPKDTKDGKKIKLAQACYFMTNGERSTFCGVLKNAKLLDGSASNISRCVQPAERKISNYKTHDAHFMLHYLLPIPIKSILPDHVAIPFIRLSSFFRRLCQKVITPEDLDCLEAEIRETVSQLERIFPPCFFDIMVHLAIHLPNELRLGGPVQGRWMYPPERFMCRFKSYVRNKNHAEGSIAEAYLVEECLNLCSRYLHGGVHTRYNRRSRNNDECGSTDAQTCSLFPDKGCPLGGKMGDPDELDDKSLNQAHRYILSNCEEIQDYVREHELEVNSHERRSKWRKAKTHSQNFAQWFESRVLHDDVPDLIKQLSRGPSSIAKRYSGYLINGYRFHVRQRDVRRKTQNSGITLVALTTSFASSKDKNPVDANVTYYGHFKVVLFKCDWYEAAEDTYGLTYVYFNKRCYQEEPFVLASQAHQCFYVQDPYDQDKHYVMKTVPRDLFSISDQLESDAPHCYGDESSEHSMAPSIPNDNGEVVLVRSDVPETIIDVPLEGFLAQQTEIGSGDEFDVFQHFGTKFQHFSTAVFQHFCSAVFQHFGTKFQHFSTTLFQHFCSVVLQQ
ncbi:uncharacterized protein LOC132613386 [Lycium barbarum]|uniref:uncharacterized protein LOC132613386 n=1 Tax=Lycium barbarum TaxID=112863 RepID=UPI00293EED32|nr:uncharacterized protein LOC132613386 [Lycium barbarum]